MVELKDASDAMFADHGMAAPQFPFLTTDPALVRWLAFQPRGVIRATEQGVNVRDTRAMTAQMIAFLEKAAELNVDIACCPEYSCTWSALVDTVDANRFPGAGKLWIIGCEGISPDDLDTVVARLSTSCTVVRPSILRGAVGNFLDCVCYLFQATDVHGAWRRVVLIQSKTHPMGGDDYEYQNLIVGDVLYRFGVEGQNRLVCLLCSDVLEPSFRRDIAPQLLHNTLVLHLQLNSNPSSPLIVLIGSIAATLPLGPLKCSV